MKFLRFVAHIIKQRRIAGEFLNTGLAVELRVERTLEQPDRQRAVTENLLCPLYAFGLNLLDRHHRVDQSHFQRLFRVILAAEIPNLAGLLLPDDAREITGTKPAVETAHARTDLAKNAVIRRDREVAHEMQHVSTADGVARHERDHDFRHRADEFL